MKSKQALAKGGLLKTKKKGGLGDRKKGEWTSTISEKSGKNVMPGRGRKKDSP